MDRVMCSIYSEFVHMLWQVETYTAPSLAAAQRLQLPLAADVRANSSGVARMFRLQAYGGWRVGQFLVGPPLSTAVIFFRTASTNTL